MPALPDDVWTLGEVATFSNQIVDGAGLAADPGALRLLVKSPAGVVTTYDYGASAMVREAEGSYALDLALGLAGIWAWRWEASAPNAAAAEGMLLVKRSRF